MRFINILALLFFSGAITTVHADYWYGWIGSTTSGRDKLCPPITGPSKESVCQQFERCMRSHIFEECAEYEGEIVEEYTLVRKIGPPYSDSYDCDVAKRCDSSIPFRQRTRYLGNYISFYRLSATTSCSNGQVLHPITNTCTFQCEDGSYVQSLQQCKLKTPHKNTGSGDCSQPETTQSTGNPIRVATGNKYQIETDISGPLSFTRYYNSELKGWSHQYLYQIQQPKDNAELIYLLRPDGKVLSAKLENGQWKADTDIFLTITHTEQTPAGWLVKSDKQQEAYDSQGRLTRLVKTNGEVLTSEWVNNNQNIKDKNNNNLSIIYNHADLPISLKLNGSELVEYTYDEFSRLTLAEIYPGKNKWYHYENNQFPFALTGITDENGVRFATWAYDSQGRAISSEHAGGKEKVYLEFHSNNSTTVTNPLGKKTTYHFQQFNGVNKVVKVEGHQSENCAAANKEYTYYPNGLLKTKTDWKGNTTEYKYNTQGLQVEKTEAVGTPQARTTTTEWDVEKRFPLKSSDGQLETQYQYDDKGKLTSKKQVSQPSSQTVEPGS